jgi:hypothetical protein
MCSMETWKPPAAGPIDDTPWSTVLVARAVNRRSDDDHLHGYAMLGDVARHYRYPDALYLAITGELPDERASILFDVALLAFGSISVNEAPCHVAVLSKICGGTLASSLGAGLVAAADQARTTVEAHSALIAWLRNPTDVVPTDACDSDDATWIRQLRNCAQHRGAMPMLVRDGMSRAAAVLALLYEAGLTNIEQLQAAMIASRLSGIAAEAIATSPKDLKDYPAKLPPFHYVERAP